jgi:hypothetical protein
MDVEPMVQPAGCPVQTVSASRFGSKQAQIGFMATQDSAKYLAPGFLILPLEPIVALRVKYPLCSYAYKVGIQ